MDRVLIESAIECEKTLQAYKRVLNPESVSHDYVVIYALKKQLPKRIEEKRYIYTKCDCGYEFSEHHGDGYYSIPFEKKTKFCPECGQALEWGDE